LTKLAKEIKKLAGRFNAKGFMDKTPPDVVVKAWVELADLEHHKLGGIELILKQSIRLLCTPLCLLFVANFGRVSSCLGCPPQNLPNHITQHSFSSQTVGVSAVIICTTFW
jgi:hypothetical protein